MLCSVPRLEVVEADHAMPPPEQRSQRCEPRKPAPPVTTQVVIVAPSLAAAFAGSRKPPTSGDRSAGRAGAGTPSCLQIERRCPARAHDVVGTVEVLREDLAI